MLDYTLYCTEEQTRKALELGAPIKVVETLSQVINREFFFLKEDHKQAVLIPTAEQMRGWLMDKLQVTTWHINYFPTPEKYGYTIIARDVVIEQGRGALTKDLYDSHNKATLAAIDAALRYLINNKK